jgi:steroid delta-isomerase-like uncharacterized protein
VSDQESERHFAVEIVRRAYEAFNERRFDIAGKLLAERVRLTLYGDGRTVVGRENLIAYDLQYLVAFPDAKIHEQSLFGSGSTVCFEFRMTGTQRTAFRGIPVTGRWIDIPMVEMISVTASEIVEVRRYIDSGEYGRQLNASPSNQSS